MKREHRIPIIPRVKEIREAKGITQNKLSTILDVPQSKISDIERGKRRLIFDEAVKIATFLNVKVDDLISKQS